MMLVGPSGGGKTTCYTTLQGAMSSLNVLKVIKPDGDPYLKVYTHICNPKSITLKQLYGAYDLTTGEWNDGILCVLFRRAAYPETEDGKPLEGKNWVMFDGPVDAVWIESMNTVLDENKKLCLVSGEIIQMSPDMTMMFEVDDLSQASPATVSRCGMIYLEPEACVPATARIKSWVESKKQENKGETKVEIAVCHPDWRELVRELANSYIPAAITFVRRNLREYVPSCDPMLVSSFFRLMETYLPQFFPTPPSAPSIPSEKLDMFKAAIVPLFFQTLVFSVGATCDNNGRVAFDQWLRERMQAQSVAAEFMYPLEGLVYDYKYLYNMDENAENPVVGWKNWLEVEQTIPPRPGTPYPDMIVSTLDTARQKYYLTQLIQNCKNVACVGPTGTGKSVQVLRLLMDGLPESFTGLVFTFSAQTSSNQLQDSLMSKFEKIRLGRYGAPVGKTFCCFVDDTNLPAKEQYGAQPPIELLRQTISQGGFYSYAPPIRFSEIAGVTWALAMGPPGGAREDVSQRFLTHFNYITFPDMPDEQMGLIFNTILTTGFKEAKKANLLPLTMPIVQATIAVFRACSREFVPTPAHVHYTFNLRDVSGVFNLIYDVCTGKVDITDKMSLTRIWYHEVSRVFRDRLINAEDRTTFDGMCDTQLKTLLDVEGGLAETKMGQDLVTYCDFTGGNPDHKVYEDVKETKKVFGRVQEMLDRHNDENPTSVMELVLFSDAVAHVCRICRCLRLPSGHALLLGIGGSGRKSLARLACFLMEDFEPPVILEITKDWSFKDWRERMAQLLLQCGKDHNQMCFLFGDTQIVNPRFLEDISNLLGTGDIPNLFEDRDLESIYDEFRPICSNEGLPGHKVALYSRFTREVQANLHVVLAFSPIGDMFRTRMRMFPSLVNCCYIDWFSEWPQDALKSVAEDSFSKYANGLTVGDEEMQNKVSTTFMKMHKTAETMVERFFKETRRRTYITPTSYLSLLNTFKGMLGAKMDEINTTATDCSMVWTRSARRRTRLPF